MELYIKFLTSVNKSLVQVCLPKSFGQKGMIYYVPAECEQNTCTGMSD